MRKAAPRRQEDVTPDACAGLDAGFDGGEVSVLKTAAARGLCRATCAAGAEGASSVRGGGFDLSL